MMSQEKTMAEKTEKKKKSTKSQIPKVELNNKQYIIVERAGTTIKLTDGTTEFCVLSSAVTPKNETARKLINNA